MKKTLSLFALFIVLASLLLAQPSQSGYAQGQSVPSPTPYPGESDFITFAMLGIQDEVMVGPFANNFIRFSTPDSWALEAGAKIVLEIEVTARSARTFTESAEEFSGALMEITLNDHIVETIFLPVGTQTIELIVPDEALYPTRSDGRHSLQLFLDATVDCLFDHETMVLVRSSSGFSFPYHDASPSTNLTLLPRPIFKLDSLLPEEVVILMPDAPTVQEMQAAMTVSASMGRMTEGNQLISMTNISTITEEKKSAAHIIMIGKESALPVWSEVVFSVTQEAENSDGVVQMTVSPWNASRVLLYIGGVEDEAVLKAAQAFSSGSLRTGIHNSLSVISNIADSVEIKDVAEDRTFSSLGYTTQTLSGVGFNSFDYEFLVPLGKTPAAEPSLTILYAHSAIFDFASSGAIIALNGEALGSIRFSEETANKVTELTINIPEYAIQPGRNIISIQAEFIPSDYCSTLNNDGLWMSVNQESLLHIPLIDASNSLVTYVHDLGLYPSPFTNSPTLSNLGFVLPSNDTVSWELGAKIAADLGKDAIGKTLTPSVFYADAFPEAESIDSHLIIVGKASDLPILGGLAEVMPARFDAGSNMAVEEGALISFSIPEGTDLGYLETFAAPWNFAKSILTVMGSTSQGLVWAESALLDITSRAEMQGDYVVVDAEKIYVVDTKAGLGTQNLSATAVPGTMPTLIPDSVPPASFAYKQDWVITAILVTTGSILFLLLGLGIRALAKRRRSK